MYFELVTNHLIKCLKTGGNICFIFQQINPNGVKKKKKKKSSIKVTNQRNPDRETIRGPQTSE
jgi:hypothetical protein